MKKKKTIILILVVAVFGAFNLMQPFQNAIACNPWDPGYNFLTGECDDPNTEDLNASEWGSDCYELVYDELWGWLNKYKGHETNCIWAVAGTCTPVSCDEL